MREGSVRVDPYLAAMVSFFMMSRLILITAIILSALPLPLYADIYRYTDANGVVHFTNAPGKGYTRVIREKASDPVRDYEHIIAATSSKYNIEPAILKAVITAESNWDSMAVSRKGAIGLMQLMPATAQEMNVVDPHDPADNIEGGARYLRHLLNRFDGDLDLALAAYNAGPGRVEQSGGIPPIAETINYVKNVRDLYEGSPPRKPVKIHKVTLRDGTILYTNSPETYQNY